jgi:hypothetical protein
LIFSHFVSFVYAGISIPFYDWRVVGCVGEGGREKNREREREREKSVAYVVSDTGNDTVHKKRKERK